MQKASGKKEDFRSIDNRRSRNIRNRKVIDVILLSNPGYLALVELSLLVGTGVLGWVFSWPKLPLFPALNVIGGVLFLGALAFHLYCERTHQQAHDQADDITRIVTIGVYSKIRHPLYLSLVLMHIGIGLAFGIIWTLIIAAVTGVLAILTALKEEEFLLREFPEEYGQYKKDVRWRLIPMIF